MKSIKENTSIEIIINKSRFITVLLKINNKDDVKEKLIEYKRLYKDATHYCYAYVLDNYAECSDDGEPQGTAGMPILNNLQVKDLTNVLCIVIRYFGGIKLGAGGLIRAYSRCANEVINKAQITNLIRGYEMQIEFTYEHMKQIDYLLKDIKIQKEYANKIKYSFNISEDKLKEIEIFLQNEAKILKQKPILMAV